MNKFGLLEEKSKAPSGASLTDRLASFPPVRSRVSPDLAAMDAAAAEHGFVSREVPTQAEIRSAGRRRKAVSAEPTRHLAIRLPASAYDRFVAYADGKKLTYHDALVELLALADG